jgi:6-phosphofructokinase 1
MPARRPRIGILTGGGDCPGLNAVIRAVVKSAHRLGYESLGFLRGYEGLVDPVAWMPLDPSLVANILTQGGTILGSSNTGRFTALVGENDRVAIDPQLLKAAATTLEQLGICGLVCIGGDGSLSIAQRGDRHRRPRSAPHHRRQP